MIDRRTILRALAFGAGASVLPHGWRIATARADTDKRLVVIILRGAMDALAAVPPYGDADYRASRAALALPPPQAANGVLDLDGRFGLHPAMGRLHGLYRAGEMAIVHAVALPHRSRSHFDMQDVLESGLPAPGHFDDGWLGRCLEVLAGSGAPRGLAMGPTVPLILRGTAASDAWWPAYTMPDAAPEFLDLVSHLYESDPLFHTAIAGALRDDEVREAAIESMDGRAGARRLRRRSQKLIAAGAALGHLLAASPDTRFAVTEVSGWDTHFRQGSTAGTLARLLQAMSEGIAALKQALGPVWRETVVIVTSEFGRTVAPNGTGGTDHGTGGAVLLAGGAVHGGRVRGRWPGLRSDALYEGRDLMPTTDTRAVYKGVLADHLGLPRDVLDARIFPDSRAVAPLKGHIRSA